VGDLTESGSRTCTLGGKLVDGACVSAVGPSIPGPKSLDTRAAAAKKLLNAGIGFYPLRGNHEDSKDAAIEFQKVFPQTLPGAQNPAVVPTSPDAALAGLTYAFDYGNARFVLLDSFKATDGNYRRISQQQAWIDDVLANRPAGTHAFVYSHKGLTTENHVDTLFYADATLPFPKGIKPSDPTSDAAAQDAFIGSLYANGVRYLQLGHDHMHDRSIVTDTRSPSAARVTQLVSASDSSKFYIPAGDPQFAPYGLGVTRVASVCSRRMRAGIGSTRSR
jgi:hypothetical protein